ncbi:MAG: hypothetical protein LBV58_04870 [Acholeplasmatales bacterium]|jgi:hypothetical protein|nr:hypothetical protein [Acholeplasmatales bacterium]
MKKIRNSDSNNNIEEYSDKENKTYSKFLLFEIITAFSIISGILLGFLFKSLVIPWITLTLPLGSIILITLKKKIKLFCLTVLISFFAFYLTGFMTRNYQISFMLLTLIPTITPIIFFKNLKLFLLEITFTILNLVLYFVFSSFLILFILLILSLIVLLITRNKEITNYFKSNPPRYYLIFLTISNILIYFIISLLAYDFLITLLVFFLTPLLLTISNKKTRSNINIYNTIFVSITFFVLGYFLNLWDIVWILFIGIPVYGILDHYYKLHS